MRDAHVFRRVPSIVLPRIQPPVVQCEYMPRRQYSHLPQAEMHETRTWSPGREGSDAGAGLFNYAYTFVTKGPARSAGRGRRP